MGTYCIICKEEVHAPDERIDLDSQSYPYSIGIEDKAICEGCAGEISDSYKRHIDFMNYFIKARKNREFDLILWFRSNLKGWSKSLFMIVFAISCCIGFGLIIEFLKKL
jgi:hypothetical protein